MDLFTELRSVVGALDRAGVPFALCGGLAVAVHGSPRATKDIDLLVLPQDVDRAKEAVKAAGFTLPALPMTFGYGTPRERRVHRVSKISGEDHLMLDLLEVRDADDEVWRDRSVLELEGFRLTVVSRNGLARLKRDAGRPQDLADLEKLGLRDE